MKLNDFFADESGKQTKRRFSFFGLHWIAMSTDIFEALGTNKNQTTGKKSGGRTHFRTISEQNLHNLIK